MSAVSPEPTRAGVIVVGAGQAGGEVCGALRQKGYTGPITLIGDEAYGPYRRPPLSKTYLSGEATQESLFLKSAEAYQKLEVDCHFGTGVEAIDREQKFIRLYDGTTLPYAHLVLATGGRPRKLSLPGADSPNVHYVRTIDDINRMKDQFVADNRLLIIGGGYIGLEAASAGIKKGLKVTVIEALPRVLARVTAPEISAFYEAVHRRHGVDMITGVGVHAFEADGTVKTVVLADNRRIDVDLIIVGVGLIPNTELAEAASLEVSNGIVVDAYTRTADPDIYAIGDCSNHDNGFLGRRVRLESVPNAIEQSKICAAAICGSPVPYTAVPWFWSDQYNLKLQMVGLSQGHDQIVIRGDMAAESFCAFYLQDGVIISADAINRAPEFNVAKKMVADRLKILPELLADESQPLKALLPLPVA